MTVNTNGLKLFDRQIIVTVGTVQVRDLRCQFKVKKTLKADPNTCEIKITNLGQDNRDVLSSPTGGKLRVTLEAGYKNAGTSLLFAGEVRAAFTEWEGPDCTTTVTTGDSEKEMQESRIHATVSAGAPVGDVLHSIAKSLNVGLGNIDQALAILAAKGSVTGMWAPGTVVSGNAKRVMTDFCRSANLEWSVQDGKLLFVDRGKPLAGLAIQLDSNSGLEGSPSVDFKAGGKTQAGGIVVKCKTRLIPDLTPGRIVVLKAKEVKGNYRLEEVSYVGDTHGESWGAELTLRSYQ